MQDKRGELKQEALGMEVGPEFRIQRPGLRSGPAAE